MGNINAASFPTDAIAKGAMGFLPRNTDGFIALKAFPVRPVRADRGTFLTFDQGDTQRNYQGYRSPLGEAGRIEIGSANTTYACSERALRYFISDAEARNAAASGLYNPTQAHTQNVMAAVLRLIEEEWSSTYFTTSIWGDDQTTPTTKWDSDDGGDPIGDIGTAVNTISAQLDDDVNGELVGICGSACWNTLARHGAFKDFSGVINVQGTQLANRQKVAMAMGLKDIMVSTAVKNTSLDDIAASNSDIVGDGFLVLKLGSPFAVNDPTAGATFVSNPLKPRSYRIASNPEGSSWVEAAVTFDFVTPFTNGGVFIANVLANS